MVLTVACLVGPSTSLNCTLRLLEHKFRMNPQANGKADYPERLGENDERFSTMNVPITSIAVSTGQNDDGLFELDFRGDRYMPFEGAGTISRWSIDLPAKFREFDYDSITDVVMQLRYTSLDGGDKLRIAAEGALEDYLKSVESLSQDQGLFGFFDIVHDFPNAWYKANQPPPGATERVVSLEGLLDRLPVFTRRTPKGGVIATSLYVVTSAPLASGTVSVITGSEEIALGDGSLQAGSLKSFTADDQSVTVSDWQIRITDTRTPVDQLWLVFRYTLQSLS